MIKINSVFSLYYKLFIFNKNFQKNLLATGAANSEIFIWDMNNTSIPMSPGVKSQPLEDISWLAWNRQGIFILFINK